MGYVSGYGPTSRSRVGICRDIVCVGTKAAIANSTDCKINAQWVFNKWMTV